MWRVGLVDVCAIAVLLVVLFMPPKGMSIVGAFDHRGEGDKAVRVEEELATASRLQATLLSDPSRGDVVEELAAVMTDLGRHDLSLRIAGQASQVEGPLQWRALGAVSSAYADRIEIENAHVWAEKAMASCTATGAATCPAHEALRLELYTAQLARGIEIIQAGADPRSDPDAFRRELAQTHTITRSGKKE